jgi:cardiolipin synthase
MNNKIITYLRNEGFSTSCEHFRYFPNGAEFFAHLFHEINNAKNYIFIEFFNIEEGVLLRDTINLLRYKIAQGVQVRLSYDPIGCLSTLPRRTVREMRCAGIDVRPFRARKFGQNNHRKTVVIDGVTTFCGGFNLADRYANVREFFGQWKDTGVMTTTTGRNFRVAPLKCSEVIPVSDSPDERVWERTFINFITCAQRYVYITTPYIVCSRGIVSVLAACALSGVDVRIITPFIADKRLVKLCTEAFYEELLMNGVRIFEYTPGFIHAKSIVSDDCRAFIGSANLDYRSLYRNYENGVCVFGEETVAPVIHDVRETLALCREITLAELRQVSAYKRGVKRAARFFRRLF